MKKEFILSLIIFVSIISSSNAQALIGKISKAEIKDTNPQVIDKESNLPINNAKVSIPKLNLEDYTDSDGYFKIDTRLNTPVILSVEKNGYKPFSITIKDGEIPKGLKLKIEKKSANTITLSTNLLHLGDNSFSEKSSAACLINSPCAGPEYTQIFTTKGLHPKSKIYLEIGSLIGIDTIQAKKLGQNNLTNAFSTPLEIFVNKQKIGELKINGDNQKIPIPHNILKTTTNTLTLKTGINQSSIGTIDYDDIELMNILVIVKN